MADVSSATDFHALPAELKVNVFAFIRTKADKKLTCLVSKEWRALMAPMLWESSDSMFMPTHEGLNTLL